MRVQSSYRRHAKRNGFSLIECAFSTFLVGVVLVASLKAVSATQRMRMGIPQQRTATDLCQQLLTEITQSAYLDPGGAPLFGPESGETTGNRSLFNDVDDYNTWSESPPCAKDGTTLAGFTGWSRKVSVTWINPSSPSSTSSTDQGLKQITVTVTDPKGKATTLAALRSSGGLGEQKPPAQVTYVTWVGVNITLGNNTSLSTGVNLANGAQ